MKPGRDWRTRSYIRAECLTCPWEKNPCTRAAGKHHARKNNHTVRVEVDRTLYYNDRPAGRRHR